MVNRFEVYLVNLDEAVTKVARNTKPCVVISPDEMNHNISYAIIAPLSATTGEYPTRIAIEFLGNRRSVVLDQLRSAEQARLVKIGEVEGETRSRILKCLAEMFAE